MKNKEKVTQADLDQLRALQYKTSCLELLLEERCDLEDDFHQHLLALAIPNAVVYNDIMQRFEGDPSGVEFKSKSGTQWAFVLPDASGIVKRTPAPLTGIRPPKPGARALP